MVSERKGASAGLPTVNDWKRSLKSLSGHNKTIDKQFPQAVKEYPELIAGFLTTIGYLSSGIRRTEWEARHGGKIDFGWMPDPLNPDPCFGIPIQLCDCLFKFPPTRCPDLFGGFRIPEFDIPKFTKIVDCAELLAARDEAYKCYEQIDYTLPLVQLLAAIDACDLAVDQANEAIASSGCECKDLRSELEAALACYANPPAGTTLEECRQEIDRIRALMADLGCN